MFVRSLVVAAGLLMTVGVAPGRGAWAQRNACLNQGGPLSSEGLRLSEPAERQDE